MSSILGSHLGEGDLVRYMDRQMEREELRLSRAHLSGCAECTAQLEAMQKRAAAVSAWLGEVKVAIPDEQRALAMAAVERARFRRRAIPWVSRGAMKAAAVVLLLLTVGFATPPGRAWVGNTVERLSGDPPGPFAARLLDLLGRDPDAPAPPVAAPPPLPGGARRDSAGTGRGGAGGPGSAGTAPAAAAARPLPAGMSPVVEFTPGGNYVLVRFDNHQREGSATLWIRNTDQASGQIVAGRRGETLRPTGDGLNVVNRRSSRAQYTIIIPTRYRFVRLKVGDSPETTITVSRTRQDWVWTVSLADGSPD